MPRYFFDLHNDLEAWGPEGKELPDIVAAKEHALGEVKQMILASISERSEIDLRHHIDARDESPAIVHLTHFEDVVTIRRGDQVLSRPSPAAYV